LHVETDFLYLFLGAMSVSVHLLSPRSKGLFSAAIMMSNPAGIQYRTFEENFERAQRFAEIALCQRANNTACLRNLTWQQIVSVQESLLNYQIHLPLRTV
jgi:carboxylesterase type B